MKVELHIDPSLPRAKLVLWAPADTPEVRALMERLSAGDTPATCTAFRAGEAHLLPLGDILRFYTDGKGVRCQTAGGVFAVRERLYELEEALSGTRFVRASNSEILNLDRVTALDLSITGTIRMTLEGGVTAYVSRRYVKKIKQALGL